MQVRLTVEKSADGLRATILERDEAAGDRSRSWAVESVEVAKRKAAAVARKHGLETYRLVDRVGAAPAKPAPRARKAEKV